MQIPKSVKVEDLIEALEPLYRLLGTTAFDVYVRPGMLISENEIIFTVVADTEDRPVVDEETGRLIRRRINGHSHPYHPQGEGFVGELAQYIRVEIER